ncbi:murein L,D-transpeptidase YcbB/YkuD [Litorimonas taeanensis]|uniref:Murein L,D-transpeptidase YcbB/YkuD n=1 Tax=Litorimonas taeanensis TaxID=568099 RepID=A0A420WEJ7_9PROT|nr:L,D-transpeptidase family protein [Litorimonas taeanensis]RKQ69418.1 murein L,D-transpeptidase YcbB/YkuD [Litorimonas taeanensis]
MALKNSTFSNYRLFGALAISINLWAYSALVSAAALTETAVTQDTSQHAQISGVVESHLQNNAEDIFLKSGLSKGRIDAALKVYKQAGYSPLWKRGAAEKLNALPVFFKSHGLKPSVSNESIQALIQARFESRSAAERAMADLHLTILWLNLALELSGRSYDMENSSNAEQVSQRLKKAAGKDPLLEMNVFAPQAPQYENLRRALGLYTNKAHQGGWKALPVIHRPIEVGQYSLLIPAIRQRLKDEGFLSLTVVSNVVDGVQVFTSGHNNDPLQNLELYDTELESGVRAFQKHHGLNIDGVIGSMTLRVMNESADSKIKQIEDTLNAWRALSQFNASVHENYIWANIPSFTVEGWAHGKKSISMGTIVGTQDTQTPSFSDEVEYIVVNPKWYLPTSVVERQMLSKLKKNPNYAAEHHYKIYSRKTGGELDPLTVDWNQAGISRKIQMVQQPGVHNSLGQMKFIFPNRHAVYMHATPMQHLFARDMRAFSAGCIRLEDPVSMANWITNLDSEIDTEAFNQTLNSAERERFYLGEHLPIHITYMPVTADKFGMPTFHRDIYNKFKAPDYVTQPYDLVVPQRIAELKVKAPTSSSGAGSFNQHE